MLWTITKDLISDPDERPRVGFGNALLEPTVASHEFRLLDGDGEVYYQGVCEGLDDADGDQAFAPLDWAMNNDGCTTMEVRRRGEEEWCDL